MILNEKEIIAMLDAMITIYGEDATIKLSSLKEAFVNASKAPSNE